MTLTICKGGDTQDFPITDEDFSNIMGIQNGKGDPLVAENVELDNELLDKFCILEKNEKYKNIDINKVKNELKNAVDDNAIKQTFALIALHYIVCPAPAGKLGKKFLGYVKDVNSLHDQPWVTVAMSALKHGIQTYNKGKGAEKNLGGCVLFLQLYCMKRRGFMEGLNVSEISKEVAEEFHKNWMIDHAPERKRKKYLVDKICKDMNKICKDLKDLSDLIKVQPEKVGLQLLLELDAFDENCKNMIAASTSGLVAVQNSGDKAASTSGLVAVQNSGDKAASTSGLIDSGDKAASEQWELDAIQNSGDKAASTSGASRIYFYPHREDQHRVEFSDSDIERLQPGKCVNSNLMQFYLRYLELHVSPTNGAITNYHFFSTFFYPKLNDVLSTKGIAKNSFDSFRRWWNKDNIFQKEYIVIPIHGGFHWSVVIVCMRNKIGKSEPILLHLDSNSSHDATQIFENIKRFMEEEQIVVNDTVKCQVPQQQNAYDCGLYALLFIERFIKQAPIRMETEYTTMFGEKWFQEKEVGDLRSRMKSILKDVLQKAGEKEVGGFNSVDAPSNDDDATIMTPQLKVKAGKKRKAGLNQDREMRRLDLNPNSPVADLSKRVLRKRRGA